MGDREFRDQEKKLRRTPQKNCEEKAATKNEQRSVSGHFERAHPPAKMNDPYSDPVYHAISYINGQINRMDLYQMRLRCKEAGLEPTGKREALKRRLKEHFKNEKLIEAGLLERNDIKNVDYFLVIDFEATCEEKNPPGFPHEIIEFPAVLVASGDPEARIVDVFHSFVRPVINPVLSEFCYNLTGITQDVVDAADPFPVVHEKFIRWMKTHSLGVTKSFSIVTDGPFDMGRFLFLQTLHLSMVYPSYASQWTNLRKCFANFYKGDFYASQNTPQRLPGLQNMLTMLDMEFEGQPHSGLDDAKNIARVLIRLIKDGALIRVNEKIASDLFDDKNRDRAKLVSVTPVSRHESEELFRRQLKKISKTNMKISENRKDNADAYKLEPKSLFQDVVMSPAVTATEDVASLNVEDLSLVDDAIIYARQNKSDCKVDKSDRISSAKC